MKESRFKFGVCHAYQRGSKIITGKTVNPAVYFEGYPTKDMLERVIVPELAAMSKRGRQDIIFPLGIYIYAYYGTYSYPRNRLYVQQIPDKAFDSLAKRKKVVYLIDEQQKVWEVSKDGTIRSI
jgi:hypothetical protein